MDGAVVVCSRRRERKEALRGRQVAKQGLRAFLSPQLF